jgi:hypothetical protein
MHTALTRQLLSVFPHQRAFMEMSLMQEPIFLDTKV